MSSPSLVDVLTVLVPLACVAVTGWFTLRQGREAARRQAEADAELEERKAEAAAQALRVERESAQPHVMAMLSDKLSERLSEAYDRLGDVEQEQMRCRERQNELERRHDETMRLLRQATAYIRTLRDWIDAHTPGQEHPPPPPPTVGVLLD